jgi:hypothetical protein
MTIKKLKRNPSSSQKQSNVSNKAIPSAKQLRIFKKIAAGIKMVSVFRHKADNQPVRSKLTFKMTKHDVRSDKDGTMFNASRFNGSRGNDNFVSANAMFYDFDKGNPSIKGIRELFPSALMWIYTTHSHTPEKPRYRVVLPLSRTVDKNEHLAIGRALKEALTPELRECLDKSCFERARPHYFPACPPDQASNTKSRFFDGSPLNADKLVAIGKKIPSEEAIKRGTTASKIGDRPGDDYVRRHSIIDVMLENGWTRAKGDKFAKPGDTSGDYHAKLYSEGVYVYSTSAPVPKGYHDVFSFLVHSSYGGDFSAAAADLKKKGYSDATAPCKRLFFNTSQLQKNQSDTQSLVGNLIKQGTTGEIFGQSGAGKTFIALDIALSIATGMDWNGNKCEQGLVFYFVGEGLAGFNNRIKAWELANGKPDTSLFHSTQSVISFEGSELKAAADELKLYEKEKSHKVALIIIDTLARHLDGDENSSNEISKFINKVDGLRGAFPGSSAIIVHHSGHGKDNRARGSSALKAAMDFEICCNNNALTFTKMKDGAHPDPISFKLDVVEFNAVENGEPVTSCVVNYGKKPERSSKNAAIESASASELSDIDRIAVEGLVLASVKCQEKVNGKYGADSKTWRSAFYDLRKAQDKDIAPGTLKKSFSRAKGNLLELGHIEEVENVVVLTDSARQAEVKDKIGK